MTGANPKKVWSQTVREIRQQEVEELFGKSRQAYYQLEKRQSKQHVEGEIVLMYVRGIRSAQPQLGTRKMYDMLTDVMKKNDIKMGRDKFFTVLREQGLLVKPHRKCIRTTDSNHVYRKYPNLIKGYEPCAPEQIWSSDITYVRTKKGYVYVSLVTDWYSKKIMGWYVSENLKTEGPLKALQMALKHRSQKNIQLIHHSDQGIQYCSREYIALLNRHGIQISMSAPGNPYENPVSERVNGILKIEYYLDSYFETIKDIRKALRQAVDMYNTCRPHASCDYLTPVQAHQCRDR